MTLYSNRQLLTMKYASHDSSLQLYHNLRNIIKLTHYLWTRGKLFACKQRSPAAGRLIMGSTPIYA